MASGSGLQFKDAVEDVSFASYGELVSHLAGAGKRDTFVSAPCKLCSTKIEIQGAVKIDPNGIGVAICEDCKTDLRRDLD